MKPRVFIDTNVFIYAFEYPHSNSALLIELVNEDNIEAFISEQVIKEVTRYFRKFYTKKISDDFRNYLLEACVIIPSETLISSMKMYHGTVKEKDLEQVAVVKKLQIKYLVSFDTDFKSFEEYITPKKFIALMGLKTAKTEY